MFKVIKSEVQHYKAICNLASSKWKNENAVDLGGVRCTFWSLGDSLRPGGMVNSFVVAAFCYHLFIRHNGHPDISKRHYFFANIADNLLKHPTEANDEVIGRAFRLSSKARPLPHCNMLFFPTFYENHWFLFVVDIKDSKFVFLDSYYSKDDKYQEHVRDRMIMSFQVQWDRYVNVDMKFDEYGVVYPDIPRQPHDNHFDSGIYTMMGLEHWTSPRSLLSTIFQPSDIPTIRIKIANQLMFLPRNSGMKNLVLTYFDEDI
uniref:Ubiquitin-like protease family profile domain-containing protein n=1 Tax=Arundo donax TaxID=35708 RepID=A0A0A8ZU00_ARUDO